MYLSQCIIGTNILELNELSNHQKFQLFLKQCTTAVKNVEIVCLCNIIAYVQMHTKAIIVSARHAKIFPSFSVTLTRTFLL